jgi:hypothetical protein
VWAQDDELKDQKIFTKKVEAQYTEKAMEYDYLLDELNNNGTEIDKKELEL